MSQWQTRIGGSPQNVTIAGDAVIVEYRTSVEAYGLGAGVKLWGSSADWAGVAGSTDLGALVKALHEGTYDTVLGPIAFDAKGDVVGYEYRMYRWHDGQYDEICCRPSDER